jgi:hypothetical protein
MKLIYIDESGSFNDPGYSPGQTWKPNTPRETSHFIVAALIVDLEEWKPAFNRLKAMRKSIKAQHGIPISEYLHAHELVAGKDKWKHISRSGFDRPKRLRLYKYLLREYSQFPEFQTIVVAVDKCTPYPSISPLTARELAYQNLLNRIEMTISEKYIIVHDGHEDLRIIRIARKLQAYNLIGKLNKPLKLITEDPLFKTAPNSYFLQAVDHIAYGSLHLHDKRYNPDVSKVVTDSELFQRIGVAAAHHSTKGSLPGLVPVPSPKKS